MDNYLGLLYSDVYEREMHAYKCIKCGKVFHRHRKDKRNKKCILCQENDAKQKILETNEKKKLLIISDARLQRDKEIAEQIEDLYKNDIRGRYDEGFNAALMLVHDLVMR